MDKDFEWSKRSIASLSNAPDADIRIIVDRATKETIVVSWSSVIIPFVVAMTLAQQYSGHFLESDAPGWQRTVFVGAMSGLGAGLGSLLSRIFVRRRIKKIANDT